VRVKAAIELNKVSKKFVIPYEKTTTLYDSIVSSFKGHKRYDEFWALRDISLRVDGGESLGVIGGNGSGKSTLLKLIANILRPTRGSIKVSGGLTPFLELGVGFQQDLSARENIFLYGKIMGLRSREVSQRMEDIVKFSGLERFIDAKLRNFSSGMQVRLAFSTAIQTNPQILLVDEVLAVGDMDFQEKCFDYFNRYLREGGTMVLVTHDLSAVRRFCSKTLLLSGGEAAGYGGTDEVVDAYVYKAQKIEKGKQIVGGRWGTKKAVITDVEFIDKFGRATDRVNYGDPLTIRIHYETRERIQRPVFGVAIHSEAGVHCYGTNTQLRGVEINSIDGKGHIDLNIEKIPMIYGRFLVTAAIHSLDHLHYDWRNREFQFTVVKSSQEDGLFGMPCNWSLE